MAPSLPHVSGSHERSIRRANRVARLVRFADTTVTDVAKSIQELPEADEAQRKVIQADFEKFWDTVNKTYRKLRDDVNVNLREKLEDLGKEITTKIQDVMEGVVETASEEPAEEGTAGTAQPAGTPQSPVTTLQITQHADNIERLMRTIIQNCNNLTRSLK